MTKGLVVSPMPDDTGSGGVVVKLVGIDGQLPGFPAFLTGVPGDCAQMIAGASG